VNWWGFPGFKGDTQLFLGFWFYTNVIFGKDEISVAFLDDFVLDAVFVGVFEFDEFYDLFSKDALKDYVLFVEVVGDGLVKCLAE
jgi:hypothetical protein